MFEIDKSKNGQFFWRLKAGNGEPLCVSEMYTTKAAAKNGIESAIKNAASGKIKDLTEDVA